MRLLQMFERVDMKWAIFIEEMFDVILFGIF